MRTLLSEPGFVLSPRSAAPRTKLPIHTQISNQSVLSIPLRLPDPASLLVEHDAVHDIPAFVLCGSPSFSLTVKIKCHRFWIRLVHIRTLSACPLSNREGECVDRRCDIAGRSSGRTDRWPENVRSSRFESRGLCEATIVVVCMYIPADGRLSLALRRNERVFHIERMTR